MLKKFLAGVAVATVLAVGGIAVAGAVAPAKHTKASQRGPGNLVALAQQTAAGTIGVDVKTLRAGVKAGHTIAQIATQHHVAPSTVVHAIVGKLDAAIATASKAGRLDTARAAKLKQRVPKLATTLVNHTTNILRGLHTGPKQQFHPTKTLQAAANTIGVSYTVLRKSMRSQTIAAIARAHGVAPAKVANAMAAVAVRNFDASAKTRRANPRYRRQIPKMMANLVNGTRRRPAHKGAKAKPHAAAKG